MSPIALFYDCNIIMWQTSHERIMMPWGNIDNYVVTISHNAKYGAGTNVHLLPVSATCTIKSPAIRWPLSMEQVTVTVHLTSCVEMNN